MKKRIVSFLLAVVLSFSITACSDKADGVKYAAKNDEVTSVSTSQSQGKERTSVLDEFLKTYDEAECTYEFEGNYVMMKDSTSMAMAAEDVEAFCFDPGVEVPMVEWNTEEYKYLKENSWMSVKTTPFSTFAADVDTASYANVRRMLTRNQTVPADAVRLEEMINYFHYDYAQPKAGEPFSVTTEMAPCPWNENSRLLMIGLNAKELDTSNVPNSNLKI